MARRTTFPAPGLGFGLFASQNAMRTSAVWGAVSHPKSRHRIAGSGWNRQCLDFGAGELDL